MKLYVLLISCVLSTTGCITVKAPENLISDSVQAGKDLYDSVKGKSDKKANTFEFSYRALANESHQQASTKCIDGAIEQAKQALNKYQLDIKGTEAKVVKEGENKVFKCSVSV